MNVSIQMLMRIAVFCAIFALCVASVESDGDPATLREGSPKVKKSEGSSDTTATAETRTVTEGTSDANGTERNRSRLFSRPRILPFLDQLFNPFQQLQPPPLPGPVIPSQINPVHPSLSGPVYRPEDSPGRPDCAANGLYCLYDKYDTTYPRDKVNSVVNRYFDDIREMYSSLHRIPIQDLLHHDNITHKYREGGHFVCESRVQYVRPGLAKNLRGEWLAIINTDNFPQVVRVEECKYASRRCEYLPPCYKSTCIQRYSFEKLLCIDPLRPGGKPIVDVFEIPTACSCFVENFIYY